MRGRTIKLFLCDKYYFPFIMFCRSQLYYFHNCHSHKKPKNQFCKVKFDQPQRIASLSYLMTQQVQSCFFLFSSHPGQVALIASSMAASERLQTVGPFHNIGLVIVAASV